MERRRWHSVSWWRLRRPLTFEQLEERHLLATITVTSLADNLVGDGQVTLREAIRAAELNTSVDGSVAGSGADTIVFSVDLSGDIEVAGPSLGSIFQIATSVTIRGNANGITVRRDEAAPEARMFSVTTGGSLRIESLMLTGGIARGVSATPVGSEGRGGAIYNEGALEIVSSTLFGHSALGGNGLDGAPGGAGLGGAIYNDGGNVSIINSTLSGNTAASGAGSTSPSSFGGGVYSRNGTLTVSNSTLTNHTATAGRGVYVIGDGADASAVIESTIIGQAETSGLISELVATTDNGGSIVTSGDGNIIPWDVNFAGTIVSTGDPQLGPLGANGGPTWTHALVGDSPAVDQGLNPLNLTVDQRGSSFVRVAGGAADIGAFERQTIGGSALAGDYNGNSIVDAADYVVWRNSLDAIVSPFSGADGDGDGAVEADDYGVWRTNFGRTAAVGNAAVKAAVAASIAVSDEEVNVSLFNARADEPTPSASPAPPGIANFVPAITLQPAKKADRPAKFSPLRPVSERHPLELALVELFAAERAANRPSAPDAPRIERRDAVDAPAIDELLATWPSVW